MSSRCCSKKWMKFFKAIHDVHRQKMMDLLHEKGRMNVGDIVKRIKLSQPNVSHHFYLDSPFPTLTRAGFRTLSPSM
jgi:DNA-binding transcriptional ArsR family regulator